MQSTEDSRKALIERCRKISIAHRQAQPPPAPAARPMPVAAPMPAATPAPAAAPGGLSPKPTYFNGVWYRGLNEARFARALTWLKVRFRYELERVDLARGRALPDFTLIDRGIVIEFTERYLKGPTGQEPWIQEKRVKCQQAAMSSKMPLLFVWSYPLPSEGRMTLPEVSEIWWPDCTCTPGTEPDKASQRSTRSGDAAWWLHRMLTTSTRRAVDVFERSYTADFNLPPPSTAS